MKTFFLWLLLGLSVALAESPEPTVFKSYPMEFTDLQAAAETVRALAGADSSVVVDEAHRRLLVVTTPERQARIAEAAELLNARPRNVRIQVEFKGAASQQDQSVGVGMQGEYERTEGLSHSSVRIRPRLQNQTVSLSASVSQSLLVASGREGRIQVGEEVPYLEWIMDCGLRWGEVQQRIQWQKVGAGMVVEPLVLGEGPAIRIRLIPELSGLVEGRPYHVRFARAATEVVVNNGQRVQIGGHDEAREFYSHFLVGSDRAGNQQTLAIFLTPHILDP